MKRNLKIFMYLAMILSASALCGCASSVVQDTTREIGGHATTLSTELAGYQSALEADAAGRIDRIASMRTQVESLNVELEKRLAIWELLGFDYSLRIYNGVLEMRDKSILSRAEMKTQYNRDRAALRSTQAKFRSQQRVLLNLAKQLNAMAEPPDLEAQTVFIHEFAREVQKKLEELEKANEESPEDGDGSPETEDSTPAT